MKKITLLIFFTLLGLTSSWSQISTYYTFSESSGTYTPITGGTVTSSITGDSDDGEELNVPIGFTLDYAGTSYSDLTIGVNGAISFTNDNVSFTNNLSATGVQQIDVIAPLWDDLYHRASDAAEIRYETSGTSPNQIFTVQWTNISWRTTGNNISFQLVLYEDSNNIQFNYGANTSTDSRTASIGFNKGNSGSNFISVTPGVPGTASTSTDNNSISSSDYPGDGVTYIFTYAAPTCITPTNVQNTVLAATTADFSWDAEMTATTGYNWVVMADGDDPTVDTPVTSGTVATGIMTNQVTGLTAATDYDFYVQSDCGVANGLSNWSSKVDFTTACAIFTAPFTEDFDTAAGSIPNCWSQGSSNSEDWKFTDTPGSNHIGNNGDFYGTTSASGGYFAWVDDSTPDNIGTTLVTSSVDVSGLTLPGLSFYFVSDNEGNSNVDFSVDIYDGANWNVDAYTSSTNTNGWIQVYIDFSQYTITGPVQARFIVDENVTGDYYDDVAIDDVSFEEMPTCFVPLNIQNSAVTDVTADFSWDSQSNASAGYNWVVMADGDDPTTGISVDSGSVAAGTTTAQATGLTAQTDYDFYVQADCGATDGLSVWSSVVSFSTACAPFSISFCENFDTTSTGTSTNPSVPDCWNFIDSGSGYGYTRAFTPNSGANSFYMYNAGDSTGDYILVSPPISNVSDGNNRVNFWVDGAASQDLIVGTMSNPSDATTFTAIQTVTLATGDYENYKINIPIGTDSFIAFKHGQTGTYDSYYLDDICIEAIPDCQTPSNIQNISLADTTAEFSWDAVSNASVGYNWVVMADGDDPAVDTPIDSGSVAAGITTAQATGLTGETDYDFYVQSNCGATDGLSVWEGPIGITTFCSAFVPPYLENFDAGVPNCWEQAGAGDPTTGPLTLGSSSWLIDEYLNDSANTDAFNINLFSSSKEEWLISPLVDLSGGSYALQYKVAQTEYNNSGPDSQGGIATTDDQVQVLITDDGGITWQNLETYDASNAPSSSGDQEIYDLSNYTGLVRVAFWASEGTVDDTADYDFFIEDFNIDVLPSCTIPTSINASNITTSSVDFSWTVSPDDTMGYDYVVMLDGDNPDTDTPVDSGILATGTTTVTVSSLSPGVAYDFYIRTICLLDGPWSTVVDFTTALPPCDLPTGITNTAVTLTTADFSWTASADETNGYIWLVMADGDDPLIDMPLDNGTVATGVTTLSVNGLIPATNYDFYIQTDCGGGTVSIVSNKVDFMTDNYPCTPPASISNNAITGTTAKLTWQTNGLETGGYNWVLMADGDDPTVDTPLFNGSVGTGITSVIISGLTPMTNYDFYVQTVCATEDSGWSSKVDITTTAPPCAEPSGVINTDVQSSTAVFDWTASPDETNGYNWVLMADGDDPTMDTPSFDGNVASGVTSVTVSGLTSMTDYDFYVQTLCGAGNLSDWSSKVDIKTLASACAEPTGVMNTDTQNTTADFSWTASADESNGYSWVVMTDGADPMVDSPVQQGAVATGVTNIQVTGLTKDTDYDFYVRTDCGSGNMSDWSTKVDFMTTDLRTSISNFQNFSYYPNPVKTSLVLEASIQEMQKVSVYNLLGQEVISIQPNSLKTNLNLEKLAAGPYMIMVTINGELKTFKVIKE